MSRHGNETEALVARLSHQPKIMTQAMVTILDAPGPPVTLNTQNRPSSIGALDALPAELLHEVLEQLDVLSLTRFSQTCFRAHFFTGSLSSYQNLLNHAPDALAALSRTQIISRHSISWLHAVLRSQSCETCSGHGAFLFLPTCSRTCWQCLQFRKERLVVPEGVARKAFGLTEEDQERFPKMRSIPGRYGIRQLEWGSASLVAVADAMELAISKYGSAEQVQEALAEKPIEGTGTYSARQLRGLLWSEGYFEPNLVPEVGSSLVGRYFGRASIRFHSLLSSGEVELGHWCRGCEWTDEQRTRLPADVLAQILPADVDPARQLSRMARTAYAKAEFLEHVQHCYGAQRLLAESAQED